VGAVIAMIIIIITITTITTIIIIIIIIISNNPLKMILNKHRIKMALISWIFLITLDRTKALLKPLYQTNLKQSLTMP
jgi:hypothetical protein